MPGPMKIREETELSVDSFPNAVLLLEKLGFAISISFEKIRETWQIDHCEVVLDLLPDSLGSYVEIEAHDVRAIAALQNKLGLRDYPSITEGYADMVWNHLKNGPHRVLCFHHR